MPTCPLVKKELNKWFYLMLFTWKTQGRLGKFSLVFRYRFSSHYLLLECLYVSLLKKKLSLFYIYNLHTIIKLFLWAAVYQWKYKYKRSRVNKPSNVIFTLFICFSVINILNDFIVYLPQYVIAIKPIYVSVTKFVYKINTHKFVFHIDPSSRRAFFILIIFINYARTNHKQYT